MSVVLYKVSLTHTRFKASPPNIQITCLPLEHLGLCFRKGEFCYLRSGWCHPRAWHFAQSSKIWNCCSLVSEPSQRMGRGGLGGSKEGGPRASPILNPEGPPDHPFEAPPGGAGERLLWGCFSHPYQYNFRCSSQCKMFFMSFSTQN